MNHPYMYIYTNAFRTYLRFLQLSLETQFKHIFPPFLFPTYGIRRSRDGSLFFVWLLQNRRHAGQKEHSPEGTFQCDRYALRQLGTDERERGIKATVKEVAAIMQKRYFQLNWINHINSLRQLDTFQITYKGFDRTVKGFPLALSTVPSPLLDLKCHIRSY